MRRKSYVLQLFIIFFWPYNTVDASSIKADETVVLFPTDGYLIDNNQWLLPFHGWVFELEKESLWRTTSMQSLLRRLELARSVITSELFKSRTQYFLADNERNKKIDLHIGDKVVRSLPSMINGHFENFTIIQNKRLAELIDNRWLKYQTQPRKVDRKRFDGYVQLLSHSGVSIISDIDDTIRVSNVTDKNELLANTFLRKFEPVDSMANVYRKWYSAGGAFHYVSAAPWQLFPPLWEFINTEKFPWGSFYLRYFRLKDHTFYQFLSSSKQYKTDTIEKIIKKYPNRVFILVGDSGENDPEIYGHLARKYFRQVMRIYIRKASNPASNDSRFEKSFKNISKTKWKIFTHAEELLSLSLPGAQ